VNNLSARAKAIKWLAELGRVGPLPGPVFRPSLGLWTQLIKAARDDDFGLTRRDTNPLERFDWLTQDGPNPNRLLSGGTQEVPAFSALTALVMQGLRDIPTGPWLVVGPVDLRGAVRIAAVHAFRMAAWEEERHAVGFWHRTVDIYERGLWPAGLDEDETILVV
jgi:hypothetical protein